MPEQASEQFAVTVMIGFADQFYSRQTQLIVGVIGNSIGKHFQRFSIVVCRQFMNRFATIRRGVGFKELFGSKVSVVVTRLTGSEFSLFDQKRANRIVRLSGNQDGSFVNRCQSQMANRNDAVRKRRRLRGPGAEPAFAGLVIAAGDQTIFARVQHCGNSRCVIVGAATILGLQRPTRVSDQ